MHTIQQTKILHNYIVFFLVVWFLAPSFTHAYFTTDQKAYAVTNSSVLFTITYSFGSPSHDTYMPIGVVRDLAWDSKTKNIGYEVLDGMERIKSGRTAGIVLSRAKIVDGMYKIPKGEAGSFTFFGIYTADQDMKKQDISIRVTELPFYWDDERQPLKLNPSELKYYITPSVDL